MELTILIEEYEHGGRLYCGDLYVRYTHDRRDNSYDWQPTLLRLTKLDDNVDWSNDDNLQTIDLKSEMAKNLFEGWSSYILDCCADDNRWR